MPMGVPILILTVTMVHEAMHEQASKKKKVRQDAQNMGPVLFPIHGDAMARNPNRKIHQGIPKAERYRLVTLMLPP